MKRRFALVVIGGSLLAMTGCNNYAFRELNRNVSPIPPAGKFTGHNTLPPAAMMMHPGPGVDGPGPGVLINDASMLPYPVQAIGQASQIHFVGPDGMTVAWDVSMPGAFDSEPLVAPARYNFPQGAIYRLKLSNIPGRPGVELYPTIEVAPPTPRTEAYLSHNAVPAQFTEEDFDQVLSGNFVTKVIYLPDAEFQELALAGVETLVSTRLDPGIDPIVEADRRGAIMAIIRIGNKDLEVPGSELMEGNSGLVQAGYSAAAAAAAGGCGPGCGCGPGGPGGPGVPPQFLSGVSVPEYGMPYVGTPIGLPGPPHIPLGHPAGLQKHVMTNHTKIHMPAPTTKVKIDVEQTPGFSYPKQPNHVYINERSHMPPTKFHQPLGDKHEHVQDVPDGYECIE